MKTVLALSMLLLLAGCSGIGKEEALGIAQEFVNNQVRFYVTDNTSSNPVQEASIALISQKKVGDEWQIVLNVSAPDTNRSNIIMVAVDPHQKKVTRLVPLHEPT